MNRSKTIKPVRILLAAVLAFALAASAFLMLLPALPASAAVRTSDLWKSSDGVKSEGTADGTKLTLTGRVSGTVNFKNALYLKNSAVTESAADFAFVFTIGSTDFTKLTLTLATTHYNTTVTETLDHKFYLENKDSKLAVGMTDGADKDAKADTGLLGSGNVAFSGTEITLSYSAADKAFTLTAGGESRSWTLGHAIKDDEAQLSMTFDGIAEDKTAAVTVKSINAQSLAADGNASFTDTVDPVVAPDKEKFAKMTKSSASTEERPVFKVGMLSDNNLPIRAYDVLQTTLKTKIAVSFAATVDGEYAEVYTEENTAHFTTKKREAGYYKVEYSVRKTDASDSEYTAPLTLYFDATQADTTKPVIDLTDYETENEESPTYFKKYAPAGKEYRLPAPKIVSDDFDNEDTVQWILWYTAPSSDAPTSTNGLKFTPSSEGNYKIQFQAVDASGNRSDLTAPIVVNFRDQEPPKITISSFPEFGYFGQEVRIPSGSVSDAVDTSPTKTVEVFFVGKDAVEDTVSGTIAQDIKDKKYGEPIELKDYRFTPTEEQGGLYVAVYTATDAKGYTATEYRYFTVKADDRPAPSPTFNFWTPWTITFTCIGAVALVGLCIVPFIKVKPKNGAAK